MTRRLLTSLGVLFAAGVLAVSCSGANDVATVSRTLPRGSTTPGTSTPTAESAAGKPCVAATDVPAAEGKPTVNVPVGPPPTTLVSTDLKEGTGEAATADSTVTVQYVGIACSTGKQFDASWDKGQPATFPLNGVIKGWTQGIPGMKVGGQRMLVIPPDLAYGNSPPPTSGIAPGETLVFVIDLQSVQAAGASSTTAPR